MRTCDRPRDPADVASNIESSAPDRRSSKPHNVCDKFHEECGVVAIYGHPEASKLAYLGALRTAASRPGERGHLHRATANEIYTQKSMGHVADIFTERVLSDTARPLAIGHTRYSTAGDTVLTQRAAVFGALQQGPDRGRAQRQYHERGGTARAIWKRRGSIFQASSDTEVILHLVAHSRERTLAGALRDALLQLEGAFSLVFLAEDRIIVARDPHGFRPLAMGEMEISGGTQVLRVRVGNLRVRPDRRRLSGRRGAGRDGDRRAGGRDARALGAGATARAVRFRARVFFAARFDRVRPVGAGIARAAGPSAGARMPAPMPTSWCLCPIRASRPRSAIRRNPGCRSARR